MLHARNAGFTLIELLVVLVVLGLIAGIGVASLGGGNLDRELQNEANRLHAVLRLAAEEAIVSNNEIGVYVDDDAYGFVVYDEEAAQWVASDVSFLRDHRLPEWASLDFSRQGLKREMPKQSSQESKEEDTETSRTPDLMLLSSGEVTGFIIGVEVKGRSDSRIEILTDDKGLIVFGDQDARG